MHPDYFNKFNNKKEIQEVIYQAANSCKPQIETSKFIGHFNSTFTDIKLQGNETNVEVDITDEVIKIVPGERLNPLTNYSIEKVANSVNSVSNPLFRVENNRIYMLPSSVRESFRTNIILRLSYVDKVSNSASRTNLALWVEFTSNKNETLLESVNRWSEGYNQKGTEIKNSIHEE